MYGGSVFAVPIRLAERHRNSNNDGLHIGKPNGNIFGMEDIVTMDKFGRLVLPGPIRKALHIQQPTAFKAEVVGNRVELTPLPGKSGAVIRKRKGLLVVSTGGPKFNAAEAVQLVRNDRT